MENIVKLHTLPLNNVKTYLFAVIFAAGNLILPQLIHTIPQGGLIFLPIYFFTLIAAYKYGIHVGILTAVLSPLLNNVLFGMPPTAVLPAILIKSVLLAIIAAVMAKRFGKVSFLAILIAVLGYQIIGFAFEWAWTADFNIAVQDFRLGIPGILIQIIGGYFVLKALEKL